MAKAKAKAKDEVVAFIVGWSLRQASGSYAELQAVATELGLEKYLPAPPSYEVRLRQALARAKESYGVIFRRAGENNGRVAYRPIGKAQAGRPTGKGVVLNRDFGGLRLEDPMSSLLQAVRVEYEATAGLYTQETVGGWLHRVLARSFHAAPFPATGGAHVVPVADGVKGRLEALQLAVRRLGSSTFDFEALYGETELARNAAMSLLGGHWSTMVAELEAFVGQLEAGDLPHPTAFTAKLAQGSVLRRRLALYGQVLGQGWTEKDRAVEALEDVAKVLLQASNEARSLRKADKSQAAGRLAAEALAEALPVAINSLAEARQAWPPLYRQEAP